MNAGSNKNSRGFRLCCSSKHVLDLFALPFIQPASRRSRLVAKRVGRACITVRGAMFHAPKCSTKGLGASSTISVHASKRTFTPELRYPTPVLRDQGLLRLVSVSRPKTIPRSVSRSFMFYPLRSYGCFYGQCSIGVNRCTHGVAGRLRLRRVRSRGVYGPLRSRCTIRDPCPAALRCRQDARDPTPRRWRADGRGCA